MIVVPLVALGVIAVLLVAVVILAARRPGWPYDRESEPEHGMTESQLSALVGEMRRQLAQRYRRRRRERRHATLTNLPKAGVR